MSDDERSASDTQFLLSKSSRETIDLYLESDMAKEDHVDNFWNKLKEFCRYANEAKNATKYEKYIAELVEKLNNHKTIIEGLKLQMEDAKDQGIPYSQINQAVMRNYNKSILIIEQLEKKSLKVENKTFQDIDNTGGHPFLQEISLHFHQSEEISEKEQIKKSINDCKDFLDYNTKMSLRECWENKGKLNKILTFYYRNAGKYKIGDTDKSEINRIRTLLPSKLDGLDKAIEANDPQRIEEIDSTIRALYFKAMEMIEGIPDTNDSDKAAGAHNYTEGSIPITELKIKIIEDIVTTFYDVTETALDLRSGIDMCQYASSYHKESEFNLVLLPLITKCGKFREDNEKLKKLTRKHLTLIWQGIEKKDEQCSLHIACLEESFDKATIENYAELRPIIKRAYNSFKDMWTTALNNIFTTYILTIRQEKEVIAT
jgi:hypothetical protein